MSGGVLDQRFLPLPFARRFQILEDKKKVKGWEVINKIIE